MAVDGWRLPYPTEMGSAPVAKGPSLVRTVNSESTGGTIQLGKGGHPVSVVVLRQSVEIKLAI
jgi:hypothetical protein